jgi:hypothetical protein
MIKKKLKEPVNIKNYGATGDGVTDDSPAFGRALSAAQSSNRTLYLPTGSYNLNNAAFHANKDLVLAGDPGGSVLMNPGSLYCYGNVSIKNLTIYDKSSIFLSLKPAGMVDLVAENIIYNGDSATTRFIYCNSETVGRGIGNAQITDCIVKNSRYGLLLKCPIDKGFISRNSFEAIGDEKIYQSVGAIILGYPNSEKVFARNVVISDNRILNVASAYSTTNDGRECQGIRIYSDGGCIIENNKLENIMGGMDTEGIYCKANDIKIRNNTLINAGDGTGAVVVKKDSSKNDILITGNTIVFNQKFTSLINGILVTGSKYTITDNKISMNSGIAIHSTGSYGVDDAVISGNIAKAQGRTTIYIPNITNKAIISGNTIIHLHKSEEKLDAAINFSSAAATAVLNITQNNIYIESTKLFKLFKADAGAKYNISENVFATNNRFSDSLIGFKGTELTRVKSRNKIISNTKAEAFDNTQ